MEQLTIGMRDLQANLAKAIHVAASGGHVLVTSRGKVVAVISGVHDKIPGETPVMRKLRRLAAEGKIRLGKPGRIKPFKPLPGVTGLTEQLLKDRR